MKEVGDQPNELLLEGAIQADQLGLAIDFDLVNQEVLDFSSEFTNEWWQRTASSTREAMRTAIQTNIATGAPLRSLEASLEPLFGRARAQVIASTETTRMFAEGNRRAYSSAGVQQVEFQTVKDSRVDPLCEALQGRKLDIRDQTNFPPIHPRCRCWIAPITDTGEVLRDPVEEPFVETPDLESINDYSKNNFRPAREVYNKTELTSLKRYKGVSYQNINAFLRGGGELGRKGGLSVLAGDMEAALAKNTITSNVITWRGVSAKAVNFDTIKAGQGITDAAFLSTTLDKQVGYDFGSTLLKVRVPKGTKAVWMEDRAIVGRAGLAPEAEVLLPRGTNLRVLDKWVETLEGERLAADVAVDVTMRRVILVEVV